jgi:hypothetical protein
MKRSFFYLNVIIVSLFLTGCGINISEDADLKNYLKGHTFQYSKKNMSAFLLFEDASCDLIIYINGKEISTQKYDFKLGQASSDNRQLIIFNNEGDWKIKSDGNIYMWNQGDLFVYTPKNR